MKAKMPCTFSLDLMGSQVAAMAAGTFNSSLAPFSQRMETLKTLQKQELLAPVEHAVAAIFVVRKAGEKQC